MTGLSRRDRPLALRATLAEWDRRRADLLQREAGSASEGWEAEIERPAVEREPYLATPAFGSVLDALDGSDESIERAAQLVELLRRIANSLVLMATSDPRTALKATRTIERWAAGFDPELLGRRGGGRNLIDIRRWRALLARTLDRQLGRLVRPDAFELDRYATIAELLETACEAAIAQLEPGVARLRREGNDPQILKHCDECEARIEGLRAIVPTRQDVRTAIDARRRAKKR